MSNHEFNPINMPIKSEDGNPIKSEPNDNANANANVNNNIPNSNDPSSDSDSDEEFYKPPEPLYDRANSLKFRTLCHRFETMWKQKSKKKKPSKEELLDYLLSKQLRKYLNGSTPGSTLGSTPGSSGSSTSTSADTGSNKQQSIFPILRLITPDKDTTRPRLWMKEKTIADTWATALGLSKPGSDYKKLVKYNDPTAAGMTACGDISMCVYEVVKKRFPEFDKRDKDKGGGVTVGGMNELLDELAGIRGETQRDAGGWNGTGGVASVPPGGATGNSRLSKKQRVDWVTKLIDKKFTPVEHKWIVRMLLQRMDFGVGSDSVINYYHKFAEDIYSANKNLKTLCATLCDREFLKRRKQLMEQERNTLDDHCRAQYLPKNNEPAVLNNTIDPMLSLRTSFETILSDLQKRHKAYADVLEKDDPLRSCLALKHPAFTCEVKLDGERILSHMKKGVVKVQTRNGKWYSNLYSPVLGPVIRKAVGEFNVEIILDGEVVAWDDSKKETIPFGDNRRVAKVRQNWLRRQGQLDPRDFNLHVGEEDVNVIDATTMSYLDKNHAEYERRRNAGSDIWLKYVVFDILYLGGDDAEKVMTKAFSFIKEDQRPTLTRPGSILYFDLMKRRRILHTLIHTQENAIEPVQTVVVRSDGKIVDGLTYFSSPEATEHGHSPLILDSINFTLDKVIPNIADVDLARREGKTDKMIDQQRARALDKFYSEIVTKRQLEGLIFKDLSSPYCFGSKYRRLGYWYKLKDDYSKRGHAADIDVVLVGAQFASGSRNAGYLNSFLVACRDDGIQNEGIKYMTLGQCNGNVVSDNTLRKLLESTGYKLNENGELSYGSWFKSSAVPGFISRRSFQHSSAPSNGGWKPEKKDTPDLWIHPEDSFVLTLNAGEITDSNSYSAGVTMRFPRITRIRAEGFDGDPKAPSDVEGVSVLHDIYFTRRNQQETAEKELQNPHNGQILEENSLFYTVEQGTSKMATKKKRSNVNVPKVRAPKINDAIPFESDIFKDKNFTVLDGTYILDAGGLDEEDAKSGGWLELAKRVRCQQHVVDFIIKHGGKCTLTANQDTDYIIGGRIQDPRVASYRKSIEETTSDVLEDKTKRGQHLRKIHQIGGIVKWTFLYSTVHRLDSGSDTSKVMPRRHDYIIMSRFAKENLLQSEDSYGLHLYDNTNMVDFKRALLEVQRQERRDDKEGQQPQKKRVRLEPASEDESQIGAPTSCSHWFEQLFNAEERKILQTQRETRLLEREGNDSMILYPDFFQLGQFGSVSMTDAEIYGDCDYSSKPQKDVSDECSLGEVSSSLLLALAAGAQVTNNLHYGVTHILCDLQQETLRWHPNISLRTFRDSKRGALLYKRLLEMEEESNALNVTLVSPEWIHHRWI